MPAEKAKAMGATRRTPEPKAKPRLTKQASLPARPSSAYSAAPKMASAFGALLDAAAAECRRLGIWSEDLQRDLPKRWEKHGDLVLLPHDSFTNILWRTHGRSLWAVVARAMKADRLARKKRLGSDEGHTYVELLFGSDSWVQHEDNGIKYNYDVTKCLYSNANVAERLRVSCLPCGNDIVCDFFAGLGYLTLAFLVGGGAKHVYSIDWDPEMLEALRRNLEDNEVADRCTVLEGDCRKVLPIATADRVVLSLLPSSRAYILAACKALKAGGGWLHIHDTLPNPCPSKEGSPRPVKPPLQRQATAPVRNRPSPPPQTSAPPTTTTTPTTTSQSSTSPAKKKTGAESVKQLLKPGADSEASARPRSPLQKQKAVEEGESKPVKTKTKSDDPVKKKKTVGKKSKTPSPPKTPSPTPDEGELSPPRTKSPGAEGKKVPLRRGSSVASKARTPPRMAALKEDEETTNGHPSSTASPLSVQVANGEAASGSPKGGSPRAGVRENGDSGVETGTDSADSASTPEAPQLRRKLSRSASIMEEMLARQPKEPIVGKEFLAEGVGSPVWREWSIDSARRVTGFLDNLHHDVSWQVSVCRLGKVGPYTSTLDHVVLDLLCRPTPH